MIVGNPLAAAETLTLLIAMVLVFVGLLRIALSLSTHFQHWVWMLLNGIISVVLGVMILRSWPETGLWVIGMFIGIDMLFYGWSLVMLALGVRTIPGSAPLNRKAARHVARSRARAAAL